MCSPGSYEVKQAFSQSLREIRQVWREEVERARQFGSGGRKNPDKDPPGKSVDQ